jgi:hypothetical protein
MQFPMHGARTRTEGAFGRLKLLDELTPGVFTNVQLAALARAMANPPDAPKDGRDPEENPFVPAGYTYLGQFVDHDLTFDAHSNFDDPNSLSNAFSQRTPRFDLDCVYGRGPEDQPYLYTDDFDGKLLLGAPLDNGVRDLQRNVEGRAIIGDPRNDENAIVAQLQSAFIHFHNHLVDQAPGTGAAARFAWARRQAQLHYQRILLDDFLPRVVDMDVSTVAPIKRALDNGVHPPLKLYDLSRGSYMPIEFSVAAYRFGHTMVRPGYRLSPGAPKALPIFDADEDGDEIEGGGLRGFRRLDPARHIDWRLFFTKGLAAGDELDNSETSTNNAKGVRRTQLAYKLDTKLVSNLMNLPEKVASQVHSLAERNMRRGRDFGLPTGQSAAARLGLHVLTPGELAIRRQGGEAPAAGEDEGEEDFGRWEVANIPGFENKVPLWFYVLSEAEQSVRAQVEADAEPEMVGSRLGELGGAIVIETFVGLMLADGESILNTPSWTSINGRPTFSMVELFEAIGADMD